MPQLNPKRVFSQRVVDYIKYRIGYPVDVLDTLIENCELKPTWQVADIGSGTGLLARLFLDFGCAVFGVEPNKEMRIAGEQILVDYPAFTSVPGSAETTGLADASMRLVSSGMAFHWFDVARARAEFHRILLPGGWVALVWHRMLTGPDAFMRAYTGLVLEYSPGWTETLHRDQPESSLDLPGFFGGEYRRTATPTRQFLDWDGLRGRTLSIAHIPQQNDPARIAMFKNLRDIFERYQYNGQITIHYETELYYGRLK